MELNLHESTKPSTLVLDRKLGQACLHMPEALYVSPTVLYCM